MIGAGVAAQAKAVAAGDVSAATLVEAYLERIAAHDPRLGAYLTVDAAGARAQAAAVDAARARGEALPLLAGVPIGLKDVIVTRGLRTTAASRMLAAWVPPYDATVVERLRAAGAVVLGKLNCDEFGMGSTTEHSALGRTVNPHDASRVPGGSSGGSACAVSAGLCAAALGTDTGGSIRQPAAHCGVVGLKPTYGRVSRYGLVAYASSLDTIGPVGRSVEDCARMLHVIAGADPRDATSSNEPVPALLAAPHGRGQGLRIGVPRAWLDDELAPAVRAAVERTLAAFAAAGGQIVDVVLPPVGPALAAYYLIAPAEASSNLARMDGVRFGHRATVPAGATLEALYAASRGEGFGAEVKRRILLGTYVLRAGHYDAYYARAQRVRGQVRTGFADAFEHADVLVAPVAPDTAPAFGAQPTALSMWMGDVFTLPASLAGVPALSVPAGVDAAGLPVGVQLMAPWWAEARLLTAGAVVERALGPAPWPAGLAP